MGSGAQALYSSPAFELFRRGLTTQTIKKFRGINAFKSGATVTPEEALDCLNVMVPGWGGLSKFRLPVALSAKVNPDPGAGPTQFWDFQQGNGTRQVVVAFPDNSLWYFTWNGAGTALNAGTLIERGNNDAPPWSAVEANNILFMANGIRMMKWTGGNFWNWGIAAPTLAPQIGIVAGPGSGVTTIKAIQRAGNVVTITFGISVLDGSNGRVPVFLNVGDTITIYNPSDASFNGTFAIASEVTPGTTYTYAQVAANAGPFNNVAQLGLITSSGVIRQVTAVRAAGVVTYSIPAYFLAPTGSIIGLPIVVTGFADATFNGSFIVNGGATFALGYASFTVSNPGADGAAAGTGTISTGVTITTSRTYAYSYVNQTTSHYSNISPTATILGPLTNRIVHVVLTGGLGPDPQVSAAQFFATLDGGGDLFLDPASPLGTGFRDFAPDGFLDTAIQGPLLNNPPPVGKYLGVGQSRVFAANLVGGPQLIAYSGYEQILLGRPEESFPPNNRIILQIGAEALNGVGVLPSGVVGYGATKRIYMLRGNVEDITITAPIQFSAFLQELPWDTGTLCFQSIQPTPFGLIFLATDRTLQLFNPGSTLLSTGASLRDISEPVYPILRRMTAGFESVASSAYFNWLERDWYGLTLPIDGSQTNNFTIFWSLNLAMNELEIFLCSVGMDFMTTLSSSQLQRILTFSRGGIIYNLPVSQDTVNGVGVLSVIPATNGKLGAYWRGGYFGNESPVRSKMFKRGYLVADQDGFTVNKRLIDTGSNTFQNPKILGPDKVRSDGQFSIGQRAMRCSVELIFPSDDVSCNVQELTVGSIATSDRM